MTELRTVDVRPESYQRFLSKAEAFAEGMRSALTSGNLDAAGLNAIHCTISACDALTAFHLGKRSRGQDHHEVITLLDRAHLPGWEVKAVQVHEVLSAKNLVEYEETRPSASLVRRLTAQSERILAWARAHLGEA